MAARKEALRTPHATARDRKVSLLVIHGKLAFRRSVVYCDSDKMDYPSAKNGGKGFCLVHEKPLSWDLCSTCPFNRGFAWLYSDEYIQDEDGAPKISYKRTREVDNDRVQAEVPEDDDFRDEC